MASAPSAAKAALVLWQFAARLKPCPDVEQTTYGAMPAVAKFQSFFLAKWKIIGVSFPFERHVHVSVM